MQAIDASKCVLLLVDYQARLMPAIHDAGHVVNNALQLGRAAHALGVPVIGTEQNPEGLGPNLEEVKALCSVTMAKKHFDGCADGLVDILREAKANCQEVVVAGCEAHVCMMQTALGLLRAGKRVWIVANACGSRRPEDHATAMSRLTQAGATIVSLEMVLFEWLGTCEAPRFKEVLKIVKAAS